jgi:ABC-type uncharacterized transport system permease subunit
MVEVRARYLSAPEGCCRLLRACDARVSRACIGQPRKMPEILLHLLCAALYYALGFLTYRTLVREPASAPTRSHLQLLTLVPLGLHSWLLYDSVFRGEAMYLGVGASLSAIIWLSVLIYWSAAFFYRVEGMQLLVLAAAAPLVLAPLVAPSLRPLPHTDLPAFRLHLVISLAAYSLLTIASLQALVMAVVERRLRGGTLPVFLQRLPPLLTMEVMLFRILAAGFVLLTLTLGSGMLFSEELFGRPLQFTHKVVFGLAAWAIFGALLAGRRIYGWRGRVALRWTLAGFLALVLAYIGTKFVLEVILRR